MNKILELTEIKKSYGTTEVLKNISFSIGEGEIVGLLGPNGSGKTTLLKIITCLMTDYKGKVLVCGNELGVLSKKAISFMPDNDYLRSDLKVSVYLSFFNEVFDDFDLDKAYKMLNSLNIPKNAIIKKLSKGMREKLQLLLTMSRNASLYIFDEPIASVDPAAREYIINTIIKNYSENSSILLSTHLIADIEQILTRAIFIKDGSVIIDKDTDSLREERGASIDSIFREEYKCF